MKTPQSPENGVEKRTPFREKLRTSLALGAILLAAGGIVAGDLRYQNLMKKKSDVAFLAVLAQLHRENALKLRDVKCSNPENASSALTIKIRMENEEVSEYAEQIRSADEESIPVVDDILTLGKKPGLDQFSAEELADSGVIDGPVGTLCDYADHKIAETV